ncbi:tyrosine-type recombinase/integrase [Fuerstiella marisgermanici]|uniref:Site-specific recombinase n=1 Tax=Fuerstiella marisgermanici TaxID=1891926 RepID=A0A1P8WG70_9PLAN|nr:tyrosine-type recombinase/integrase [Fuerstiella marisgermanici]APZ93040.1 Site-specific recombinase [Fuerstiella marisgermanici]
MRDITIGDAKDFRRYLQGKLAEDTVRRTCGIAKQFFQDAVDRRLISRNPFKHRDLPTATGAGDKSREFFISRDLAKRVLDALPTAQWRAMFALARYAGMRCPSEVLSLRWTDIDWARERIIVTSPKTEHHEGGASREIPLFLELRPYLEDCFELADDGAEFVITDYRKMDSSYGTLLTQLPQLKSRRQCFVR